MKIETTFRQVDASIPVFKQLMSESVSYDLGYKLFTLGEKLDKIITYVREKAQAELKDLDSEEQMKRFNEILDTRIEIDFERIPRDEFIAGLKPGAAFPPINYAIISFALTPVAEEEPFKVI